VTSSVIDAVFHGGLTTDLISALEMIFNNVPTVRRHIQSRLCIDITFVLELNAVVLDEEKVAYRSTSNLTEGLPAKRAASNWGSPSKGLIRAIKGSKPQKFFNMSPFVAKSETKAVADDEILVLSLNVLASPLFFPRQYNEHVHLLRICTEFVMRLTHC
jgi:hypothetical protein